MFLLYFDIYFLETQLIINTNCDFDEQGMNHKIIIQTEIVV